MQLTKMITTATDAQAIIIVVFFGVLSDASGTFVSSSTFEVLGDSSSLESVPSVEG